MKPIVWAILIAFVTSKCLSQEHLPGLRYWQRQGEIAQRFQNHDYRAALGLLRDDDNAVPNSPNVIFRMAIAEAFLHDERASLSHLKRLVEMGVYFDLAKEPAFDELKKQSAFDHLTTAMEKIRTTAQAQATTAFEIPDRAFLPEGITYDAQSGDFFVSSIRKRKIVRISSIGRTTDFITPHQDGIWGVTGIGVDTRRRLLWACSVASVATEGYSPADKNNNAVFAFDIDTGKLAGRYALEKPGKRHFCDGLVVARDGAVFVADSEGLTVYRLDPGARELQVFVSPETGISPQGLALSRNGNMLFVSNYLSGIYAIDLKSGRVLSVHSRAKQSLAGIDGLISYGNDLIAIQNGIQPNRVVRLKMNSNGATVNAIQVLEINHPLFGEPTLGVVKGDTLFFIANSPMTQYLKDQQLGTLPNPVILVRKVQ